ncbi:hypothetical protein C823_000134 [Eubacterium plexicaudatum ASF492]|nr:hypothetical protein C823_000134 [Eubacterium plexicaudatum ASF492]
MSKSNDFELKVVNDQWPISQTAIDELLEELSKTR